MNRFCIYTNYFTNSITLKVLQQYSMIIHGLTRSSSRGTAPPFLDYECCHSDCCECACCESDYECCNSDGECCQIIRYCDEMGCVCCTCFESCSDDESDLLAILDDNPIATDLLVALREARRVNQILSRCHCGLGTAFSICCGGGGACGLCFSNPFIKAITL
eukprot:COSAG01_NODE_11011_length_2027_cov_9.540975_2_plen_162_part_00